MPALFDEFVNATPDQDAWEQQRQALEAANTARDFERKEMFRKLTGLIDLLGHEIANPTRRTVAAYEALDLVYELERWM